MYRFNMTAQPPVLCDHLKMGDSSLKANSRYFIRNGKPFIPVMGEIHFSRVSSDEWEKELAKMKAGGINVVATYIFWIYHEEEENVFDFSDGLDLRRFVQLCQKVGLDVILRLGPWAHGECRNGGFPDWLLKKPFPLRDNNDGYLKLTKKWYSKIYDQVNDFLYKDGGPIIGIQLENEFVHNASHLLKLKNIAIEVGFDVPFYTVTGWNSAQGVDIPEDEVIPVFGGYPEAPWAEHTERLEPSVHYFFNTMRNDSAIGADLIGAVYDGGMKYERYPFATCELGGGIQVTHHRRPLIKPMDIYALSLVKLGSGNNLPGYYMYHGGTNKIGKNSTFNESKETGYPNDYPILSYDFQAAIGEYGIIREQYRLLRLLHLFVADFGDILAPMDAYMSERAVARNDLDSLRYSMRTDGRSGFVFVNHYQRLDKLTDCENVQFSINNDIFPDKGIAVRGEQAFILPFNLRLGEAVLKYATCQLICRQDNTYFFMKLEGIDPEYVFANGDIFNPTAGLESSFEVCGAKIITLTKQQALYMQKSHGKVYIGDNCDLFFIDDKPTADACEYTYYTYNGIEFEKNVGYGNLTENTAEVEYTKITEPDFTSAYFSELDMIKKRAKLWYSIKVTSASGYVCIDYAGDTAQLYADGELVADDYYYGKEWVVPSRLLYNRKVVLAITELDTTGIYLEITANESLALNKIYTKA